jgi:RNA polymerase sigma-70 factor (ECF subfamily)
VPFLSSRGLADSDRLPELIDRLYRAAWGLCGSPHDAEDLVQETFVRVLARPRALRRDGELPYLLGALRNTYLTGLRTASRRPRTSPMPADEAEVLASPAPGPVEALEQREVLEVVAALPQEFRDALVAIDVVGLSYAEAAGVLDAPAATIATRVFRARRRVAGAIERPAGRGR